jgi:hypothetical protein
MTALIDALREHAAGAVRFQVRTDAPHWMFQDRDHAVECSCAALDVGVVQPNGLDLDLPASLAAHERFLAGWEDSVEREARFMQRTGAMLVIGDVPALAFAAASRAGVRAVAVASFSWDWILEEYAQAEPRWRPIIATYREAYRSAEELFRLPLHGEFTAFRKISDAPLLVRRSRRPPGETRAQLGIAPEETRPVVLVSFGGFGHSAENVAAWDDLSDFLFVGFGDKPEGLCGEWISMPHRSPIPHEELMAACDAVLGKPGYGTVAEALTHRTRFLYVPRENFREMPILEEALARYGCARRIPRADFQTGQWRRHLEDVLDAPSSFASLRADGAEFIAEHLYRRSSS